MWRQTNVFFVNSWFVFKILFLTLTQSLSVPLFALRSFHLGVAVESREKCDIMEAVVDFLNAFHVNASGFSVTLSLFLIFLGLLYWWVNGLNPSLSVMLQLLSVRRMYRTQSILSKRFQTVSALNQSTSSDGFRLCSSDISDYTFLGSSWRKTSKYSCPDR